MYCYFAQVLSDTSDTLERWLKVQMMWCSLESVFTGGDIAKQMPLEAKKFAKVSVIVLYSAIGACVLVPHCMTKPLLLCAHYRILAVLYCSI
jgi:Dynein heavy chain, N-terminal region 2